MNHQITIWAKTPAHTAAVTLLKAGASGAPQIIGSVTQTARHTFTLRTFRRTDVTGIDNITAATIQEIRDEIDRRMTNGTATVRA